MAKRTRLPKDSCTRFMDVLRKSRYTNPGTLARVVLESIIFDDGRFSSDIFYSQNAGLKGSFTRVRDALVKDEFISLMEPSGKIVPKTRLKPYVEDAKKQTQASVGFVVDYVDSKVRDVENDVKNLKSEMKEIRLLIAEIQRLQAPPPSAQAQEETAKLTIRLQELLEKAQLQ